MCLAALYFFPIPTVNQHHRTRTVSAISPSVWASRLHPSKPSPFITNAVRADVCIWRRKDGAYRRIWQIVSKLTFRNVSCFAFRLAQRSAAFPEVRKCSLNKPQKVEGRRFGYLYNSCRQAPLVSHDRKAWSCLLFCICCLVNWKEL